MGLTTKMGPSALVSRNFLLRLVLVQIVLIVASGVVDTILARFLQPTFTSGAPAQDALAIYDLILGLYSLGYIVVYLLVFYFIGYWSSIEPEQDWFALLEYLFLGAVLGGLVSYFSIIPIESIMYGVPVALGEVFGVNSAFGWLGLLVSFIRGGVENALMAFGALVIGTLLHAPPIEETIHLETGTTP
jgi:hypothetical protein